MLLDCPLKTDQNVEFLLGVLCYNFMISPLKELSSWEHEGEHWSSPFSLERVNRYGFLKAQG